MSRKYKIFKIFIIEFIKYNKYNYYLFNLYFQSILNKYLFRCEGSFFSEVSVVNKHLYVLHYPDLSIAG